MKNRKLVVRIEAQWDYPSPPPTRLDEVERDMANIELRKAAHDLGKEVASRLQQKVAGSLPPSDLTTFIDDIKQVYQKHGLAIGHEDWQGSFTVVPLDFEHIRWIENASDERTS